MAACVALGVQTAELDQFDRLLFVTLTPVGTLVLLGALYWLAPRLGAAGGCRCAVMRRCLCRLRGSSQTRTLPLPAPVSAAAIPRSQAAVERLRAFAVRAALLLVFLVYPGVSTEIAKSFRCVVMALAGPASAGVVPLTPDRACGD